MEPTKPPDLPQELWERMLAYQRDDEEFRERKERFLSSLDEGDERLMDRALSQLRTDERKLKERGAALAAELQERYGMEL